MRGLFMCIQVRRPAITHWRNYYQVAGCTSRNINDCHQSVFLNTPRPIHPLDCVNTRLINQENEAKNRKDGPEIYAFQNRRCCCAKDAAAALRFRLFYDFLLHFFPPDRKVEPRVSSLCWFFFLLNFYDAQVKLHPLPQSRCNGSIPQLAPFLLFSRAPVNWKKTYSITR